MTATVLPSVTVVIPTRDRPELVRAAIESVRTQNYAGALSIIVVFDGRCPDPSLAVDGPVPVRVIANDRKTGLCGSRNTGILAASAELVAFLDDDDEWLPGKLTAQVPRLLAHPDADLATTSVQVDFDGRHTVRRADTDLVPHSQLLASRMSMLHSSTFLIRRTALLGTPGLVDEDAPYGQNEDWELLLRYSDKHSIVHVDQPLVSIRWGGTSMFAQAWRGKVDGARWVLDRHPDIATSRVGYARVLGQIAFAHAALGERRMAVRVAAHAIRVRWREARSYLALAVVAGVPPRSILAVLHRWGRGV